MRLTPFFAAFGLAVAVSGAVSAETVKVGVTPGSHERTFEFLKPLLKEKGIEIEIVSFNDYVLPNQALDSGDIQMNSFQHKPYLDAQIAGQGYKLAVVGTNILEPLGIYSKKVKAVGDLKDGAVVAIPSDPSNGGRALLLLASKGLVSIAPGKGITPSVRDIVGNPKKLKFKEIDASYLPRTLPDVDAAAINTNFALEAGLNPLTDAILLESGQSPYANVFVVREQDKNAPWVATVVETYRSPAVRQFILETFKGAVVPTF